MRDEDCRAAAGKCAEKTARGNVFRDKRAAKVAASNYRRRKGAPMHWFRCPVCRNYHIGQYRTPEELRQLRRLPPKGGAS